MLWFQKDLFWRFNMLSHRYDVICIGGGLAGVCFAISCAKQNKKVLIVEKNEYLGGSLLSDYCANGVMTKSNELIHSTCLEEILEEMKKRDAIMSINGSPSFFSINPEELKIILLKKCEEYGVEVLFHAQPIEIETKQDKIVSTTFWGKGERITVFSTYFIDCTGIGSYASLLDIPYFTEKEPEVDYCISICNISNPDLTSLSNHPSVSEVFPSPERNRVYVRFSPVNIGVIDSDSLYKASVHFAKITYDYIDYMRNKYSIYKDMKLSSVPQSLSIKTFSKFQSKNDTTILTEVLDACGNAHNIYLGELCPKEYSNLLICGKSLGSKCNNAGAVISISESAGSKLIQ